MKKSVPAVIFILVVFMFAACKKTQEMTLAEIAELTKTGDSALIEKTIYKEWKEEKQKTG